MSLRDLQPAVIEHFMTEALGFARAAGALQEVPVGAVIVLDHDPVTGAPLKNPEIVSGCHNNRESNNNPVGHAELLAIEEASRRLGRWRLTGCTLYVTLEPCLMCSGAIILARVDRVVYGAPDPKAGAVRSLYQTLEDKRFNHRPEILTGILDGECSKILKDFFALKRQVQKN